MDTLDPMVVAYLAGCIDSDGYITISLRNKRAADGSPRRYYTAVLGLSQITSPIPSLLRDTFGGTIVRYSYKNRPNSRPCFMWQISNAQAAEALRALQPHLLLKRQQAGVALDLAARMARSALGQRLPSGEAEERERLRLAITALNRNGRPNRRGTPGSADPLAT